MGCLNQVGRIGFNLTVERTAKFNLKLSLSVTLTFAVSWLEILKFVIFEKVQILIVGSGENFSGTYKRERYRLIRKIESPVSLWFVACKMCNSHLHCRLMANYSFIVCFRRAT